MRARQPDVEGYVDRDGVKIAYEVFGDGELTVVFAPPDSITHSRVWKAQVPYLARRYRVVTIDPRGNGRSDRPVDPAAYSDVAYADDVVAVMDTVGAEKAVLVGLCNSSWRALLVAASHPERVLGVVSIATWAPYVSPPIPGRDMYSWDEELDTDEGWAKDNKHYYRRDYRGYVEFFFSELLSEPHSTKQWEDAVEWGLETDPESMILSEEADICVGSKEEAEALLRRVTCPVLAIHGAEDRCQPATRSSRVAELTGGELVVLEGAGHLPNAREPVVCNVLIRDFLDRFAPPRPPRRWTRSLDRRRRVLYLSSPIGLGHARRDLAIARAMREQQPDLVVDWLAQPPVTGFLEAAGETVHPASAHLAGEVAHVESEAGEHDLHAFQAIRRMDEILVANFMVFHDLVEEQHYDLWIADEAWDVDYFLHENPELKRAAYAWMTDFVGWLPFPDGGDREAFLAADYNAEMVEHIARYPRLRDAAVFVGRPDDIVPDRLGPGLPGIREWTEAHFDFAGYVTGIAEQDFADREDLRARLGYAEDERICLVSVGGSGVGEHLLRRVVAAYPEAKRRVPDLRMVVVAGPRIDPASLRAPRDVEVHGFLPDLHLHHAACDLGVVQGGLTTTMELTAAQRPFLYFPLRHHFEQSFHVAHRLDQRGAGRRMDYATSDPDTIAAAIAEEIVRPARWAAVESDGAARAAAHLCDLV